MAPNADPLLSIDHYDRTDEQDLQLGICGDKEVSLFVVTGYCVLVG